MLLRILDVELSLPDGTLARNAPSYHCDTVHELQGDDESLKAIELSLIRGLTDRGYAMTSGPRHTLLARGEQSVMVHHPPQGGLVVRVDDAESHPRASLAQAELMLAGIRLRVPAGTQLEPGRERHDVSRSFWEADWLARDADFDSVVEELARSVTSLGLMSQGVWRPAKGAPPPAWRMVEGWSRDCLVKIRVTECAEGASIFVAVSRSPAAGSTVG